MAKKSDVNEYAAIYYAGERVPAPGKLFIVQDLANAHFEEDPEADRSRAPEPMSTWLRHFELFPQNGRLSPGDTTHVLQFRHAIRRLLEANHYGVPDKHAIAVLNRLATAAILSVEFDADGTAALRPRATGIERVLGELLAVTFDAMRDGFWQHLKICRADDCSWAFFDRSKNGSGAWCTMSGCGNRAKAKAYRERRKA